MPHFPYRPLKIGQLLPEVLPAAGYRYPSPRRNLAVTERQKENWSGVLLAALMVGIVLGGLLVLRLMGN